MSQCQCSTHKQLNKYPVVGRPFCPCRKDAKTRPGRGEDSESLPPLDSPHSNGQKGVPFWISPCEREMRQKADRGRGNRKGELPDGQSAHPDCHSEQSEESVALVLQEKRQRETDPSTSLALRSGWRGGKAFHFPRKAEALPGSVVLTRIALISFLQQFHILHNFNSSSSFTLRKYNPSFLDHFKNYGLPLGSQCRNIFI